MGLMVESDGSRVIDELILDSDSRGRFPCDLKKTRKLCSAWEYLHTLSITDSAIKS